MSTYIRISSYSNGRLLTASGPLQGGKLYLEPAKVSPNPPLRTAQVGVVHPPLPSAPPMLDIPLAGQQWTFLPGPAGSGAYFIVNREGACVTIPSISLTQDADAVTAAAQLGDPVQLWYIFADTNNLQEETGPCCFLFSALCMNSTHPFPNNHLRSTAYIKVLDVKGDSKDAGAEVDAYPIKSGVYSSEIFTPEQPSPAYANQLWYPSTAWPIAPYSLPPSTGLQGNSNYFFGNYVIDIVRSLKVTVFIDSDLVCDQGVSFQLNGFDPASGADPEVWQQYSIALAPNSTSLYYEVNNWTLQEFDSWQSGGSHQAPFVDDQPTQICQLPHPYLPAGTTLSINVTFEPVTGEISAAAFEVTGPLGASDQPLFKGSSNATVSPAGSIVAYQCLVVGYGNGALTTFAGGSGKIIYESNELISVAPSLNFQYAWGSGDKSEINTGTGEDSNMNYSFLPPSTLSPATKLTQTFQLAGYVSVRGGI